MVFECPLPLNLRVVYFMCMTSFFEYLTKDGAVLSTAVVLLGVVVIIASAILLSGYNFILMLAGIFVGIIIIIIGGKYSKFKKEEN